LLLLTLTLAAIWWPRPGLGIVLATAGLSVLTVLSHNITMVVFVLAALAAAPAFLLDRVPKRVLVRSAVAATSGLLLYALYIRPLVAGWNSTGNPTPVLVSFAAHAGIPTLALAGLGSWLTIAGRSEHRSLSWWTLVFAGSFCVFVLADISWNPRYFVFFMPAMWVLAAHAIECVGRAMGSGLTGAAWYASVGVLLLPGLLSHYQDGSRHDYRQAAAVLREHAGAGQPILSDDAETISYYLPDEYRRRLFVRTKVTSLPTSEFFLVTRANAWMALPRVADRRLDPIAEIYRRRFDQFSHIVRVYRVAATGQPATVERRPDSRPLD
jgi:hypothetical protein